MEYLVGIRAANRRLGEKTILVRGVAERDEILDSVSIRDFA
jgi:hypothetical protein